jgi:hypothetical protein
MSPTNGIRARTVALTLVLAVGVAACSSSTKDNPFASPTTTTQKSVAAPTTAVKTTTTAVKTATTAAALPDPCTVVTLDDAIALAGTTLQPGVKAGRPDDVMCTFAGGAGPTAQVEYYFGDGAKKYLDVERRLDHKFETLTGVGDEAYLEDFNLFFRVGTRWNAIRLVRLDDFAAYREPLIELAKQTVTKW